MNPFSFYVQKDSSFDSVGLLEMAMSGVTLLEYELSE